MKNPYNETESAQRYDSARSLPPVTKDLWLNALSASVPEEVIEKVLDLGCGTGRFTTALAEHFGCPAIGVEPSEAMLEIAMTRRTSDVEWKQGDAENIPLPDHDVDMVFMSQVFHHLTDASLALAEIARVLTPFGYLAIRNSTLEHIRDFEWLKFFPEAREVERDRTPSADDVDALVARHGFVTVSHQVIHQLFASSYAEYLEKISRRGLSSLIAISDSEFQQGLERFKQWVDCKPGDAAVYEPVDLFIFRKAEL